MVDALDIGHTPEPAHEQGLVIEPERSANGGYGFRRGADAPLEVEPESDDLELLRRGAAIGDELRAHFGADGDQAVGPAGQRLLDTPEQFSLRRREISL